MGRVNIKSVENLHKMGTTILLNDLLCEFDADGLIVGDEDLPATDEGKKQAKIIAEFFHSKVSLIGNIASSDADRVSKLIHYLRVVSPNRYLIDTKVKITDALRERSFGVLVGSRYDFGSSVFSHSRVLGEGGESLSQCRDRATTFLDLFLTEHGKSLIVSHPLVCQLLTNIALEKSHTWVTSFWLAKGSFVVFNTRKGRFGYHWEFEGAYNAILGRSYNKEEIYNDILGTTGYTSC